MAQISSIRAKPTKPGDRLTKPQEDRLIRGLPATGPGSRGGRGSRGRRSTRGRRPSGEPTTLADSDDSGPAATPAEFTSPREQPVAGPSGTHGEDETPAGAAVVDQDGDVQMATAEGAEVPPEAEAGAGGDAESEDELREIDDADMQALQR